MLGAIRGFRAEPPVTISGSLYACYAFLNDPEVRFAMGVTRYELRDVKLQ